jgi:hypothetical protein
MSLAGFTKRTFSRGVRFAFRKAYALRHAITDVKRIIITNVRDRAAGRRLSHSRTRGLGTTGGVDFDVQVSVDTMVDADAFKAQVGAGGTAKDNAVLAAFKAQIQVVAASGEFDDVTPNFETPKALSVVTEEAVTALETGAPTPTPGAPTPTPETPAADATPSSSSSGAGILGGGISAAVLFAAAVALVWRRRSASSSARSAVQQGVDTSDHENHPALQRATSGEVIKGTGDHKSVHEATTLHEGTLSKKGTGVLGKWQPRRFKLVSHYLMYTDKGHEMSRSINLNGVASCTAVGNDIVLVVAKGDSSAGAGTQTLRAANAQSANQWSAQINAAMQGSSRAVPMHDMHTNPMQVRTQAPGVGHDHGQTTGATAGGFRPMQVHTQAPEVGHDQGQTAGATAGGSQLQEVPDAANSSTTGHADVEEAVI